MYRKLETYQMFLNRITADRESFILAETTFTKKITIRNDTIIFNEDGAQDSRLLQLINRVRKDASDFRLDESSKNREETRWFDLTEKPPEAIVCKVDITSAYWSAALLMGLVSEETSQYLKKTYTDTKQMKSARLKALGSLATRKNFTVYEKGIVTKIDSVTEKTREVYMYVCSVIDEIMRDATFMIPGAFYYYVDCIFANENVNKELIDFIDKHEYGTTTEFTEIDTFQFGNSHYIVTANQQKMYLTPADKVKMYRIPPDKTFLLNL